MAARTRTKHRFIREFPNETLTSPRTTWHKIHSEGHCRMCLRSEGVRQLTRHHIIPESWFMSEPTKLRLIRNAHANSVPLCRPCHDLVDGRNFEDQREEARRMLRRTFSQQEIAFVIAVVGKDWLDQNYPDR